MEQKKLSYVILKGTMMHYVTCKRKNYILDECLSMDSLVVKSQGKRKFIK